MWDKIKAFADRYFDREDWAARVSSLFNPPEKQETEFLPAALEIVETPPLPASRAIAATIILFFLSAIIWACLGSIDIIAVAPGKIVPTGRSKTIQPFETGVVRAIHVRDGQKVKAGDVLLEIDTTISAAERDRLKQDYMQAQVDCARLQAALNIDSDPLAHFIPPDGATPGAISLQKSLLLNQVDEILAKLNGLDHQVAQHRGDRDAIQATINKLKESIPYLQKRADARDYLANQGYGSKLDYLTIKQDLVEHQQDLKVQSGRLAESEGAINALEDQRRQTEDEYKRTVLKDLNEAREKVETYHQQEVQAAEKYKLQTLTAPVDGTVQQLDIHTEGGVVTPAQPLMTVVPDNSGLEIEAMVSNRDIGFVHAGQIAAIKVDTFNFTKYGLLYGRVEFVSPDAISQKDASNQQDVKHRTGDESESSEPGGQELVYTARIIMAETQMQIDDSKVNLTPGMAVTVEIKTGQRRVIEYLLSPLTRHIQQAMHER